MPNARDRSRHISGRYDLGTGREKPGDWLSEKNGEALVYVVSLGVPADAERVGFDLAHEGQPLDGPSCTVRGATILRGLRLLGLVERPYANAHLPTERGRIAAALHMARRPGMVAAFFDDG